MTDSSSATIAGIENDKIRRPRDGTLHQLAKHLQVDTADLVAASAGMIAPSLSSEVEKRIQKVDLLAQALENAIDCHKLLTELICTANTYSQELLDATVAVYEKNLSSLRLLKRLKEGNQNGLR